MPTTEKEESREDRFKRDILRFSECNIYLVPNISNDCKCWVIENVTKEVMNFISQELAHQQEELIRKIEEIQKEKNKGFDSSRINAEAGGYNSAIKDITNLIKEQSNG